VAGRPRRFNYFISVGDHLLAGDFEPYVIIFMNVLFVL
jgi:hypothetical protein